MKSKEKELLLQLYSHPDQFQTAGMLAEQLDISERTIRTYIRNLEHAVSENGAQIQAKQGKGYRLFIQSPMQFDSYIHQICHKNLKTGRNGQVVTNRTDWILNRLLLEDKSFLLDDACDELYVSRSTLSKDLRTVAEILAPYHLSLRSRAGRGTWISGEESDKRAFIMDYFFRESKFTSLREYLDHSGYFDDVPLEMLIMIILEESHKGGLELSDFMIQNILLHLALSIKRIRKGLRLNHMDELNALPDTSEFQTAASIVHRIEDAMHMDFPPEEISYLTLHLGVKGRGIFSLTPEDRMHVRQEIIDTLGQMDLETGYSLHEDESVINPLLEHIVPLIVRLHQGVRQGNPLTEETVRDHPDVFWMTRSYFCQMPCLSTFDISDDEWAYLTLHIMAALENASEKKKLQVLLICATGYGSSQLLKNRIEREFSDSIHIVRETGYFNMNDDILEGIDLIISSVNIGPVIFGVPFIHVSLFLNEEDVEKIQKFITVHGSSLPDEKPSGLPFRKKEALFDDFIKADYFEVFDTPVSQQQVLNALIHRLADDEAPEFEQHIEDQIKLRQTLGSIVFSDTVAVPHPAMPVSKKAKIAVALIPGGLSWDDQFPSIQMVFLLSPSYMSYEGTHHMVQGIVNLIDRPEVQKLILEKPTFENFRNQFIQVI